MPQSKVKTHVKEHVASCQNCKSKFTIEPEDFEFYQKMEVPEPTFCPECRAQRRMAVWNDLKLYKREDDYSGEQIFSEYSSSAPVKVYDQKIWESDKWDALEYGREYDFKEPFFEQFKKLITEVPFPSRVTWDLINCDYCKNTNNTKNGYLLFSTVHSENCAYGYRMYWSKDSYDCMYLRKSELCAHNFMLENCYKSFYSFDCKDCQEIYFCKDCINCQNCFGCANLRHKKYHIFNKPYTKQEYEKKLKEFNLGSFKNVQELNKKARTFWLEYPVKFMHGRKNVNVSGDYIDNSKNVINCYSINNGEDLKYCQFLDVKEESKDTYDQTGLGLNVQNVYESNGVGKGVDSVKFGWHCISECRDLEYCIKCSNCSDCFACVGLRHKHHCILNKQYTKSEYEKLVPKIKKHMNTMPYVDKKGRIYKYGEFFPVELSPFAYNETIANEYFPLTKEQALEQGYSWYDNPKPEYQPTIKAADLPDNIKDVDKSILKEVIQCGSLETKFPKETRFPSSCAGSGVFRIIPQEYEFYKKMNLPLPRTCPDCRHRERIKQRNPMKLWERQCMNKGCSNTFQTTYAPDRPETVYCEACYNKAVG